MATLVEGQSTITPGEPGGNLGGQVASGPLSSLYNSKYDYFKLQYPRDLGVSSVERTPKGHSVVFSIFEVNPFTISEVGQKLSEGVAQAKQSFNEANFDAAAVNNKLNQINEGLGSIANDPQNAIKNITSKLQPPGPVVTRTNTTPSGFITLYMPETLEFNYAAQYNELSLAAAAGSLPGVGSIANAITSYISPGGNAAVRLGLNYAGYVFNPQEQLLFEGISFRTYNMSFTFTPFSSQEAQTVKNIIQKFREHAAPEIVTEAAGFFFNPPSFFDISFLNNGELNLNINRLKRSVLENVDVNYAPNGWSAHEDGAPVQTTMTLQFKEIELVDRQAVREGY